MHVHLCLCLCLCFDRGQRCLVHLEELRSSYKVSWCGCSGGAVLALNNWTIFPVPWIISDDLQGGWGKYLKSKKLFRPSFQLPIYRKYKDCEIMLKSTKSSDPNTHCWHPTVEMPYTFINELYKGTFYNKEMYFSRFSKSQFMPNRRGDKIFVVDS